jgi:hypothetical protein
MSTRRTAALRLAFVITALSACSDDAMMSFPEEDASDQDAPSFDIPTDTGSDTGTDRGNDVPVTRDRGNTETTVCPASCGASAECDPCRTADTPSTVQYCCISGLCVSMTGTCPASTDGGPGDADPGDAAEGGADAPSFDDTPDPTHDAPDPTDDGPSPPADAASDLGGDASTAIDATAGDATAGDATAGDATVTSDATATMDARADGGG